MKNDGCSTTPKVIQPKMPLKQKNTSLLLQQILNYVVVYRKADSEPRIHKVCPGSHYPNPAAWCQHWVDLATQSEKYLWCSAGFDCNYVWHYARHYIAVSSLLATMALYGNGRDPQWYMSGIHNMHYSYHCSLIGQSTIYL